MLSYRKPPRTDKFRIPDTINPVIEFNSRSYNANGDKLLQINIYQNFVLRQKQMPGYPLGFLNIPTIVLEAPYV